jgi:hypothetical protein
LSMTRHAANQARLCAIAQTCAKPGSITSN